MFFNNKWICDETYLVLDYFWGLIANNTKAAGSNVQYIISISRSHICDISLKIHINMIHISMNGMHFIITWHMTLSALYQQIQRQNGRNSNAFSWMTMQFVPEGPIDYKSSLAQMMAWHWSIDGLVYWRIYIYPVIGCFQPRIWLFFLLRLLVCQNLWYPQSILEWGKPLQNGPTSNRKLLIICFI